MMGSQFSDAQRGPDYASYAMWESVVKGDRNPYYSEKNQKDFIYWWMMGYDDPIDLSGALAYANDFLALSLSNDYAVISPYGKVEGKTPLRMAEEASMLQGKLVASNFQLGLVASNDGDDKNPAHAISVANAVAALGPIGIMFDIGIIVDSKGNAKNYFTIGWANGFGFSIGMGYSYVRDLGSIEAFGGKGGGFVSTLGRRSPFSFEMLGDRSSTDYMGGNYRGFGGNIGLGAAYYGYVSRTFLFSPPPDFWSRPGSRR